MPIEALRASPRIRFKHIDGPLLEWGGRLHWLTIRERFLVWIGRETAESIAQRVWPDRQRWAAETARPTGEPR